MRGLPEPEGRRDRRVGSNYRKQGREDFVTRMVRLHLQCQP
jgi:hypothetical protein